MKLRSGTEEDLDKLGQPVVLFPITGPPPSPDDPQPEEKKGARGINLGWREPDPNAALDDPHRAEARERLG
jgi:hypothetical protein